MTNVVDVPMISGESVMNFLRSRNSKVDFIRDTLDVVIENSEVVVRLVDKVSGGSTCHVTTLDPETFEQKYSSY